MRLHRRFHQSLAAALAAFALATPSALAQAAADAGAPTLTKAEARHLESHGYHATDGTSLVEQYLASHGTGAPGSLQPAPAPPAVQATDAGFDWGAAAIGAAAAAAIIALISLSAPRLRVRNAR